MPKIKTVLGIEDRRVVSQTEWLVARKKLLLEEKKFSKLRDELNLRRRQLPWVKLEKNYVFEEAAGKVSLADLFCGNSQLIIYHFMFGPGWEEGCAHCSFWADHFDSVNIHIGQCDTAFAVVSRAVNRNRAIQEAHGLEVPMGFVGQHRLQFRFSRLVHA